MEAGSVERTRGLTRGFCELTLEALDPAALAGFYKDLFGWDEISRDDDRVWLGCGERSRLGLWTRGAKEFGDEGGRHVHFRAVRSAGSTRRPCGRAHGARN